MQFVEASHSSLWSEAVENADTLRIKDFEIPVIDKEHLVAMWGFAGRAKDYQKIAMFREAGFLDETKLSGILGKHTLTTKWNKEKWKFTGDEE